MKITNRCIRIKYFSVSALVLLAVMFGTLALAQDIDRNGNWYNQPQWEKGTAFVEFPEGSSNYMSSRSSYMDSGYVDIVSRQGSWYNRPDMEKGTAFAEFPEGVSDYSSTRSPSRVFEPSNVLRRGGSWYNRPIREKGTAFAEFPADQGYKPPRVAAKPTPEVKKLVPTPTPAKEPAAPAPPEPPKPTPKPTAVPAPEVIAPLDKIYFDYDKSDLRDKSKQVLILSTRFTSIMTRAISGTRVKKY